ncbi:methyltransferase [Polynucleobacter sp. MG-27-Goln-C1]|uniref:methyltransferase n=1 Tax=Polynucleobacter sp. MG-27-Goln-C1 TaxID=1819726 RepID=UPI001C0E535F|nr:methyltransferase [Polynucleobacter sp. MG-27-Goln-C1]MBU3612842.1 methyltransferase [Polynucleobacter sp. MG-27-Goln-C1]
MLQKLFNTLKLNKVTETSKSYAWGVEELIRATDAINFSAEGLNPHQIDNEIVIARNLYSKISRLILKNQSIRHFEPSLIHSVDDDIGPNIFLVELFLSAYKLAWESSVQVPNPELEDAHYFNVLPGEHYRLLKSIACTLHAKAIVEIGTYTGMGSIAFSQGIDEGGTIHTFDIKAWNLFSSHLNKELIDSKKVIQILGDLSDIDTFNKHSELLNNANIIFMDAPKDGDFEYKFLSLIQALKPKENKLLIIDDIRFVNMIDLWRSIKSPKLDISSLAHWSGTGLVDISNPLLLAR